MDGSSGGVDQQWKLAAHPCARTASLLDSAVNRGSTASLGLGGFLRMAARWPTRAYAFLGRPCGGNLHLLAVGLSCRTQKDSLGAFK